MSKHFHLSCENCAFNCLMWIFLSECVDLSNDMVANLCVLSSSLDFNVSFKSNVIEPLF